MCGIVGFLSAAHLRRPSGLTSLANVVQSLTDATRRQEWEKVDDAVATLAGSFDQMMSFAAFRDVVCDPPGKEAFRALASALKSALDAVTRSIAEGGSSDLLRKLNESLRDYLWQVEIEVLGIEEKLAIILPDARSKTNIPRLFLAWSIERVLGSLDKLEVRGRDSAGITIVVPLRNDWLSGPDFDAELKRRTALDETATGDAVLSSSNGHGTLRVMHKVANLVGRLGDNGAALRAAIKADTLLWTAADALDGVNIVAHTRWASNGHISVPNCHPVSGEVVGKEGGRDILAVINGDVDNYEQLLASTVRARGFDRNHLVTTDAKILPVMLALDTDPSSTPTDRVMTVLRGCRGSLATAVQFLHDTTQLVIGQQGSGQALYVGPTVDGWLFASEVYGLAAACRNYRSMNTGAETGVVANLAVHGTELDFSGRRVTGESWNASQEPISIFSRDIFRGEFDHFIEKEIAEAPASVRKTFTGKYAFLPRGVEFHTSAFGNGAALAERLHSSDRKPVRRILVIGHGTASISGFGIAYLLKRALSKAGLDVEWSKASELFGFASNARLDDTIVVAVSQSGTTTDTNRIVDIARKRGAWVHAIVNRRNSSLVQKSDSYLYTSDGRDVEMSVASTKAYYSQIAAGKLLSLFLADQLHTMDGPELAAELMELESLPAKIESVLELKPQIAELAKTYALRARNWALVGNGSNRIAAEEIRIKLSELCYKAIPSDVTEDKKHIDLSTEPLTIVVANDLPEEVVQDTVKETAIFKAHNGRPLVLCTVGENRFDSVAQAVLKLPEIGGGLGFVLATVAGHLFGVAAAKAIDASAQSFRIARAELTRLRDNPALWDRNRLLATLTSVIAAIESGATDTAMPAGLAMKFSRQVAALEQEVTQIKPVDLDNMIATVNALVEELSRPIDTIRHQAKTVTVGVSRPQLELSPLIEEALWRLNLPSTGLRDRDREILEAISPLINKIKGAIRYSVTQGADDVDWMLQAGTALGESRTEDSRYTVQARAAGTKRTALRTGSLQFSLGRTGEQCVVVAPIWQSVPTDLLLMDLELLPQAPITQMISILKMLRSRYDELVEAIGEYQPGRSVAEVLEGLSPRDVIFQDAKWLMQTMVEPLQTKASAKNRVHTADKVSR
jgi:glucosamine--fructose-6-phosphate aminotransferase (isomerizing)